MITHRILDYYVQFNGDIDLWARMGVNSKIWSEEQLSVKDWNLIDLYVEDIYLAEKGLLAESYLKKYEAEILANCENIEVIAQLRKIVAYRMSKPKRL